jgi:ubiquinone/menaquinone biosynthesis C-methylase UbiE
MNYRNCTASQLQATERKKNQAHSFYQIATGNQAEMECAKSTVSLLSTIYQSGMTIADIGCGAGHYLRSFRKRLDPHVKYVGIDAGKPHVKMARKAFGSDTFVCASIDALPIVDDSFDIVICNNVITSLAPPPDQAFRELIRISRNWVVVRLIIGAANYIVKVFPEKMPDKMAAKDFFDCGSISTYRNIYTSAYISDLIRKITPNATFTITADTQFGEFNNDNPNPTATRVVNGMQIAGNLVIDQRFLVIKKDG